MTSTSVQSKLTIGARWCAIALGFSLPISTALDNMLLGMFLVLWLFSGDLTGKLQLMRGHPVALMACALAALMLLGTVWSDATTTQLRDALVDALRFAALGAFANVFLDSSTRDRAQFAFLISSALVLVLSFVLWSGMVDSIPGLRGRADYPVVFRQHVTHGVLMAVAAVFFALHGIESRNRRARMVFWVLSGAAIINVYITVPTLAGQLGLGAAIVYVAFAQRGWRTAATAGAALIVLAGAAWIASGARLDGGESIVSRFEVQGTTLELIGEHPVIGVGSGAFRSAYEAKVRGTQAAEVDHPHNAFLHVGAELGLLGLAALISLLVRQWRIAGTISSFTDRSAARSFVIVIVAAGLVSISFGDHAQGLFYAWASGLLFAHARRTNAALA